MGKGKTFKDAISVHHIIWQKHRSRANVDMNTNKMLLWVLKHRALNTLVNENQSPQEQLSVFYEKYWKPVLSEQVCKELERVLSLPKEDFYKQELLKKNKK